MGRWRFYNPDHQLFTKEPVSRADVVFRKDRFYRRRRNSATSLRPICSRWWLD
jgi:hypothetical protein